jgi:hypothetical protein
MFEPKATLAKYPKALDFGARVGMRTAQGRDDFRKYFDSAIDVPGLATEQLGRTARENGVYLLVFNEDAILVTEINPGDISRGKYDFDVVGQYARPDIFRLHVNEKPAPPVSGIAGLSEAEVRESSGSLFHCCGQDRLL